MKLKVVNLNSTAFTVVLNSFLTSFMSSQCRLKFKLDSLQVDNQLPLTPSPVLFMVQESQTHRDFLLKGTITMQDNGVMDSISYPYIGIQVLNASVSSSLCFFCQL